jgi:uncharacterized membrane protein YvbJ
MKFCTRCGNQLFDEAVICPACGCSQQPVNAPAQNDKKSFGFALLGFFIPVAGLILYLLWKDTTPLKAKSAGKGALVSTILYFVFIVIYVAAIVALTMSGALDDTFYDFGSYISTMLF